MLAMIGVYRRFRALNSSPRGKVSRRDHNSPSVRESYLAGLKCTACGASWSPDSLRNLCSSCGKVLYAHYDLQRLRSELHPSAFLSRPATLWRYRELLPVVEDSAIVSLGEGMTPLLDASDLARRFGLARLVIKDEGRNPTGTFKARGISVAVSKARELSADALIMPSAGNAGAALAAYGARAGLEVHIVIPRDTPDTIRAECQSYGARVYEVDGPINEAGRYVQSLRIEHPTWFDLSTLKEPYRVEGKKTMGFELLEQLGWNMPDVIIYPTGGGTGLIGIWKAFDELESLGWIGRERPRMVVVQAAGCAPIVRAFQRGQRNAQRWEAPETIAAGLRVPEAFGDYLILDIVRQSAGTCVTVTDEEILEAMRQLARTEGILACPEGAATLAALPYLRDSRFIDHEDRVLLLNTGSGLNYVELLRRLVA